MLTNSLRVACGADQMWIPLMGLGVIVIAGYQRRRHQGTAALGDTRTAESEVSATGASTNAEHEGALQIACGKMAEITTDTMTDTVESSATGAMEGFIDRTNELASGALHKRLRSYEGLEDGLQRRLQLVPLWGRLRIAGVASLRAVEVLVGYLQMLEIIILSVHVDWPPAATSVTAAFCAKHLPTLPPTPAPFRPLPLPPRQVGDGHHWRLHH